MRPSGRFFFWKTKPPPPPRNTTSTSISLPYVTTRPGANPPRGSASLTGLQSSTQVTPMTEDEPNTVEELIANSIPGVEGAVVNVLPVVVYVVSEETYKRLIGEDAEN